MDYRLLLDNWTIEHVFDMESLPGKPNRYSVQLRNTKTTEGVFAYGDTIEEAFLDAVEATKDMRK